MDIYTPHLIKLVITHFHLEIEITRLTKPKTQIANGFSHCMPALINF